jgi:hypothetical protein
VFAGEPNQTFVSLAVSGRLLSVTTLGGELIVAEMGKVDERITYDGLQPGIRYGILLSDPSMNEIGVFNAPGHEIHYLNRGTARWVRTETIETPESPQVVLAPAQLMALGLGTPWDVMFRSSTGSTRRYLVVDTGSNTVPLSAPRLLQVAYDFTTSASTVTVIATGAVGQRWFGGGFSNPNVYVCTLAGGIARINVNTGVITNLVASGSSKPLFYADLAVRVESGTPQLYVLDFDAYLHKVNGNTGAVSLLGVLTDDVHGHSIVIDGNSGLAFTATGYATLPVHGFVNATIVYKCSFTGTSYTKFAGVPVNQPLGVFTNFFGLTRFGNNDFGVINNPNASLYRVNSFAGPWTVLASPTGGSTQSLIADGARRIYADFSQGSINFSL